MLCSFGLSQILGSGMSNKMWDVLLEHAKTCVLSGNHYIYYTDALRNVGVVFNNIYELAGLIAGEQYLPADTLSDSQKVCVFSASLPLAIVPCPAPPLRLLHAVHILVLSSLSIFGQNNYYFQHFIMHHAFIHSWSIHTSVSITKKS